jgi:hypothetical protein
MSNYKAIIAKIDRVTPIPNADRIHLATVLGESVIVSKDWDVGKVGVLFVAGTQLSEVFTSNNNLFRDAEKNVDKSKKGFFETSRRVRCQPMLGVKSEAFFADLASLEFTGDVSTLKVGDSFEELNGVKVCNKYLNEKTLRAIGNANTKARKKDATPLFKEHIETCQFKQGILAIQKGDLVSIQAKVHGTSQRVAYTKVLNALPTWKEKVNQTLNKFGLNSLFAESRMDYVVGTRRVVLSEPKEGFHGSEQFRYDILDQLKPYLSKGMTLYLEVAGYANGKPIMATHSTKDLKNKELQKKYGDVVTYKYGCKEHQNRVHVYRITLTTDDGTDIDFTQKQLVDWCNARGILPALDVVEPFVFDGDYDALSAKVEALTERPEVLGEDFIDPTHLSEGVIVRVDRGTTTPLFLKSKNFYFKVMEGIASEKEVDMEDAS